MDALAFVSNLRRAAEQTAVKSVLSALEQPPGRRPEARLERLSQWFNNLDPRDREMLVNAIALTSEQTTYNVLLVLDGLLTVESTAKKAQLELFFVDADDRTRLNDPEKEELSALFKKTELTSD